MIRPALWAFDMEYCVQLSFENVNFQDTGEYGADHDAVAEGLGCMAVRVRMQEEIDPAIEWAEQWVQEHRVPVVIEIILERVTNIAMGAEIDKVLEFEELALGAEYGPSAVGLLD